MITTEYVKPKLADEKRIESQEAVVGLTPRTIRVQGSDAELYESEENSHLVWPVLQIAGENEIIYQKVQVNGLPADLYLEGSDQHRGWFHSSLLASIGTRGVPPYRAVLTHGYVVDGEGRKMSKSVGNVVAPQEVIDKHGAEVLRLWVSSVDYREDIRISDEILNRLVDAYRRIRNTCRYLLGNIGDLTLADLVDKQRRIDARCTAGRGQRGNC